MARSFSVACIDARCEKYGKRRAISVQEAYSLRVAREVRYCTCCGAMMVLIEPMVEDAMALRRAHA